MPTATLPPPPAADGTPAAAARLDEPIVLARGAYAYSAAGGITLSKQTDDVMRAKGMLTYELMLRDSAVASSVGLLVQGILGEGPRILPAVEDPEDPDFDLASAIADDCTRALEALDRPVEDTLRQMLTTAFAFGNSLAEVVFAPAKRVNGRLVQDLQSLVVLPRDIYQYVVDQSTRVVAVAAPTRAGQTAYIDPMKFLRFTWGGEADDPNGQSGLRPAYDAWNLKKQAYPHELQYLFHFASPSTVVSLPLVAELDAFINRMKQEDASFELLDYVGGQVKAFQNASFLLMPGGSEFTMVESKGNGAAFHGFAERCDREIAQAILGAARATQQSQYGSRADSQTADDMFGRLVRFGQRSFGRAFEWGPLYLHTLVNRGPDIADRLTPRLAFASGDQESINDLADAVLKLRTGGAPWSVCGPLLDKMGLETPEDEPPPQPAVAPPPPPGQDGSGGPAPGQQPQDQQQQAA